MSNFRFELDWDGVSELMKSEEMKDCLNEFADAVIGRCEGDYKKETYTSANRSNVLIDCADYRTYYKNLQDNELLKAL